MQQYMLHHTYVVLQDCSVLVYKATRCISASYSMCVCVVCRRIPHWGPLESFSMELEESLRGARLWLRLWVAFGFRRLGAAKDVEQCLVSALPQLTSDQL